MAGIHGNKVKFSGRSRSGPAEDRNEPGSNGAKDGTLIDRYYIRVWDSSGINRLVVDHGAGAPVPMTGGNLQIHMGSCSQ